MTDLEGSIVNAIFRCPVSAFNLVIVLITKTESTHQQEWARRVSSADTCPHIAIMYIQHHGVMWISGG